MSIIKKIRSKIVHSKIFVQRSMSYVTILNSGMILFLVLSRLENYNIDIKLETWLIPIFFVTLLLMIFFGFIEDKLGFFEEEVKAQTRRNTKFYEIDKRLENIEKILKNGKNN